jgi:hypothetical protein
VSPRRPQVPAEETGLLLDFSDIPEGGLGLDVSPGTLWRNSFGDYWLVVATTPDGAQILRYNQDGEIMGVTRYAKSHVREKLFMGRVELPLLKVTWEPR